MTTGAAPASSIMHVIVMRRDVYEANRWIAQSLTKAFYAAQKKAYEDLAETAALKSMLPWLVAHVEEARREMGPTGGPMVWSRTARRWRRLPVITSSRVYRKRQLGLDELFAPESL